MKVQLRTALVAVLSLAALGACSVDGSTVVTPPSDRITPAAQPERSSTKASKTKVNPLHRDAKLANAITVSQKIGPLGGTLSIPAAGVTVTVPAGALLTPVSISMTALPGDVVAYEFAPHGLVFLRPVSIAQKLANTKEKGHTVKVKDPVELGYFALPSQLTSLLADVDELSAGTESADVFTSRILHFSGYTMACGRR